LTVVDDTIGALCKTFSQYGKIVETVLFGDQYDQFHTLLRSRSKSRIYLNLHPLIVPLVENLVIKGRKEFEGLIKGYNDL
jgi:hypothetical protein